MAIPFSLDFTSNLAGDDGLRSGSRTVLYPQVSFTSITAPIEDLCHLAEVLPSLPCSVKARRVYVGTSQRRLQELTEFPAWPASGVQKTRAKLGNSRHFLVPVRIVHLKAGRHEQSSQV